MAVHLVPAPPPRAFGFVALADDNFWPVANTKATDSARVSRANRRARLIARPCPHVFTPRPLADLPMPAR